MGGVWGALTEIVGCQVGEEANQSSAKICGCLDTHSLWKREVEVHRKCHAHMITSCTPDLAAVALAAQCALVQLVAGGVEAIHLTRPPCHTTTAQQTLRLSSCDCRSG